MDGKFPIFNCDTNAHPCNIFLPAGQDIIRVWTTVDAMTWFAIGFAICALLSALLMAFWARGLR